ncbi:DUF6602 domain-containing protein [Sphingomonas carotinifaciens]|uniref:DUF6602 domain-containing protein n=1 Tax=Sphingomonas carotinifaciens TaxID=1166323 RepID=UPI0012373505|nr:DUF6602 domain-containing protein [Sphingomonas carotinifaciens]
MLQATAEISSEYARIYATAARDPGTAGDEGEENWAALFRDWLPATYHVATKGQIIASDGRLSPQVDVVVLEPDYPKKLREKRKWVAGGVVAAFECKTTLTATHVRSAIERCVKFKSLYENRTGTPYHELNSPLIYGLLAHSHAWKGAASEPIENIERAAREADASVSHPRFLIDLTRFLIDLICVADLASWAAGYASWVRADRMGDDWKHRFHDAFGGPLGVTTTRFRYDGSMNELDAGFTPLGVLIAAIPRRMAWRDTRLRSLSGYLGGVISGSGTGYMRPWTLDVYSNLVRQRVEAGQVTNGWPGEDGWAGWNMSGP